MDSVRPLTFSDVLATQPEAPRSETRQIADNKGRIWNITLQAAGDSSAIAFYDMSRLMQSGMSSEPLRVRPPKTGEGTPEEIVVTDKAYKGALALLAASSVQPPFSVDEWVITGERFGAAFMESCIEFASQINGLDLQTANTEADQAKKD